MSRSSDSMTLQEIGGIVLNPVRRTLSWVRELKARMMAEGREAVYIEDRERWLTMVEIHALEALMARELVEYYAIAAAETRKHTQESKFFLDEIFRFSGEDYQLAWFAVRRYVDHVIPDVGIAVAHLRLACRGKKRLSWRQVERDALVDILLLTRLLSAGRVDYGVRDQFLALLPAFRASVLDERNGVFAIAIWHIHESREILRILRHVGLFVPESLLREND